MSITKICGGFLSFPDVNLLIYEYNLSELIVFLLRNCGEDD